MSRDPVPVSTTIAGSDGGPCCEHLLTADTIKFKLLCSTLEFNPNGYFSSVLVTFKTYSFSRSDENTWILKCSRSNLLMLSGASHLSETG